MPVRTGLYQHSDLIEHILAILVRFTYALQVGIEDDALYQDKAQAMPKITRASAISM